MEKRHTISVSPVYLIQTAFEHGLRTSSDQLRRSALHTICSGWEGFLGSYLQAIRSGWLIEEPEGNEFMVSITEDGARVQRMLTWPYAYAPPGGRRANRG